MSTQQTRPGDRGPKDIVGPRVLVGIQMVDISRLSAHPVPMTTEGLITVAGQGPKDSNGAGKSSFIAALSLLHADEQWRLASGASCAAELLFTAELAAQDTRWSNAERGYVIGVFADPAAEDPERLRDSALTVWLRINRRSPYLDLRWAQGLHIPYGSSDSERASRVDQLWGQLPRSNGRTDFHATRLASVLYGDHVRCVSFLSTSVRSSPTANLLAQPLNELSPERIFDAVATLTGLDRELEQEQALRSREYGQRTAVAEAEADLDVWEREIATVEAGIAHRATSRQLLGSAQQAWLGRCARHLLDGVERAEQLGAELASLDDEATELSDRLEGARAKLAVLRDDAAFADRFRQREVACQELLGRDRELEREQDRTTERVEDRLGRLRQLRELARAADGRDLGQATAELAAAQAAWQRRVEDKGAAEATLRTARRTLADAQGGNDVAARQVGRLREAGIATTVLLDAVALAPAQRQEWEPRLAQYREAVVVAAADAEAAVDCLGELPGSMLVLADAVAGGAAVPDGLPTCCDQRFALAGFLGALARRGRADTSVPVDGSVRGDVSAHGEASVHRVDGEAGVLVVGGFVEPLTGSAVRIAAAEQACAQAQDGVAAAQEQVDVAKRALDVATRRVEAARAQHDLGELESEILRLRAGNDEREELLARLRPSLERAQREYDDIRIERRTRDQRQQSLIEQIRGIETTVESRRQRRDALVGERDALGLGQRQADWGQTSQAAQQYLLDLPDEQQRREVCDWNEEACHQLNEVVRLTFAEDAPVEQMPAEIRELLIEQRWRRGGLEVRVRLVPAMLRAMRTHLANTEAQDRFDQEQILQQRAQRSNDLQAARQGLAEASRASEVHRSSLATGIKAKLRRVAEEFDRIDRDYGGYGAGLDFPEPEPPTQPDRPWRWAVTPKWRRAEHQRFAPYHLRANTAQMDEKAVKLVCAASLAGSCDRPLLLVLDELGRNLGSEHRREAVALFERIGADRNITVVGALQDDMERYAVGASGLYVKLRRSSDTMAYNEAPIVNGSEPNRARVAMLAEWLGSYRPGPETVDDNILMESAMC